MRGQLIKLGYVAILAGAVLAGSVFHVLGSTTPTVFRGCLTGGGTLIFVTTQSVPRCPAGTTAVSWNQQGPPGTAGGLSQILEVTASTTFNVPAGVTSVLVEAWGGGGGGSDFIPFPDCISSAAGGSGGYLRTVVSVNPGESLSISVGAAGAAGVAGGTSSVTRGSTVLVSAGGGGAGTVIASPASAVGGAGGQVVSPGGIVRPGNPGGSGVFDFMCAFGPGNPPSSPAGLAGLPIQGSVAPLHNGSAGGSGTVFSGPAQAGGPGEVILTW
ncbi:MAG TPA: hypothetical protein VLK30_11875 [Candidatus Limnocylindrales bacterium]|nr:hypothetical protein [Candidatus Limnocylindrales bacterium]